MNKNLGLYLLAIVACCHLPQTALADEVWHTEQNQVIYQEDRGNTAIWSYGDGLGIIFIEGLAGQYTDRGSYRGYWVQDSASVRCDTYREGIDGKPSYYWGRIEIKFIDPDFPSRWQLKLGRCEQKPTMKLHGTPIQSSSN